MWNPPLTGPHSSTTVGTSLPSVPCAWGMRHEHEAEGDPESLVVLLLLSPPPLARRR